MSSRIETNPKDLFFQPGPACRAYENLRDADDLPEVRNFIEEIWTVYAPHADPGFLNNVRTHFHQRSWEMYLWYVFHRNGLAPQKVSSAGPEFFIMLEDQRFWVEAIAPQCGDTEDAVHPPGPGRLDHVPEANILLRMTSALDIKLRAYKTNRKKGIIHAQDGYIIAINGWEATGNRPDGNPPWAIKAAVGIGDLVVSVDVARKMPPHWYHQPREHVVKNGSPVGTAAFLTAEYAGVSALLYSSLDLVNAGLRVRDPLGSEMYYFHNPQASTPLPRGPFKFGREYVANLDQGKLTHREWHKARP